MGDEKGEWKKVIGKGVVQALASGIANSRGTDKKGVAQALGSAISEQD